MSYRCVTGGKARVVREVCERDELPCEGAGDREFGVPERAGDGEPSRESLSRAFKCAYSRKRKKRGVQEIRILRNREC